jgi:hypothetical protein
VRWYAAVAILLGTIVGFDFGAVVVSLGQVRDKIMQQFAIAVRISEKIEQYARNLRLYALQPLADSD